MLSDYLTSQWGILVLVGPAIVVWALYEIVIHWQFSAYLEANKFPRTSPWPLSIRAARAAMADYRFIGNARLIRRTQWCIVLVSLIVLLLGLLRAVYTRQSGEFGRGGALLVIGGLISVYLGLIELKRTQGAWDRMLASPLLDDDAKNIIRKRMERPVEEAQFFAARISLVVSIIGTVVWAYGDQVIECGWPARFDVATAFCHPK